LNPTGIFELKKWISRWFVFIVIVRRKNKIRANNGGVTLKQSSAVVGNDSN